MNLSFRNLLLPKRVPAERPWARVCIKLYRAEGLPSMSAGIMGGFSKIIGEKNVFIDPYVQVSFCGQQVSVLGLGYSFSLSALAVGRGSPMETDWKSPGLNKGSGSDKSQWKSSTSELNSSLGEFI